MADVSDGERKTAFGCYHCDKTCYIFTEAINHSVEYHRTEPLKLKIVQLDSNKSKSYTKNVLIIPCELENENKLVIPNNETLTLKISRKPISPIPLNPQKRIKLHSTPKKLDYLSDEQSEDGNEGDLESSFANISLHDAIFDMEESPFSSLHIDSAAFLDEVSGRSKCPQCQRSRKYYCYTCYIPLPEFVGRVPKVKGPHRSTRVPKVKVSQRSWKNHCFTCYIYVPEVAGWLPNDKLPIKVDIIKHPSEVDGKSTAVHAAVVAPDDVTIYTYPCIPDYKDKDKVVLVFPGENSVSLEHLAEKWKSASKGGNESYKTADDLIHTPEVCKRKAGSEPTGVTANKSFKLEKHETGQDDTDGVTDGRSQIRAREEQSGEINVQADGRQRDTADDADKHVELCVKPGNEGASCLSEVDQQANCEGSSEDQESDGLQAASASSSIDENKSGLVPNLPIERVVFVDSTWNQTRSICGDERLKGLVCIELESRETKFWRHQQDVPNTYLSTIEAIYYFMCDLHSNCIPTPYTGEYDNLLFFFSFMYNKIRSLYNGGDELQAYKKRKGNKVKKSDMTGR